MPLSAELQSNKVFIYIQIGKMMMMKSEVCIKVDNRTLHSCVIGEHTLVNINDNISIDITIKLQYTSLFKRVHVRLDFNLGKFNV